MCVGRVSLLVDDLSPPPPSVRLGPLSGLRDLSPFSSPGASFVREAGRAHLFTVNMRHSGWWEDRWPIWDHSTSWCRAETRATWREQMVFPS